MTFQKKYNNIKQTVQNEIDIIEKMMVQDIELREPLCSHIINFLKSPSKRVRSLVSLLYIKALEQDVKNEHLEVLSAVEIVHNASLIHDDIIDNSDFRRGDKTISYDFGNKLGVISGDYLLSVAMNKIYKLNSIEVLGNFSKTLYQMCVGEVNQNFDRFKIGDIENYIDKSKNKTAYLFETAIVCPQILSNNISNINSIFDFGMNIGIAFQIRDDLLNLSNVNDSGKPVKNDINDGIYNAPVIYAGSVENYSNGIAKTKDLLNNYINKAISHLENLPENDYKYSLGEFLELLKYD